MGKLVVKAVSLALGATAVLCALATPGALATPVECGEVVTEDTVLDDDLSCSGRSPGIEIGAGAVTLDLNGHLLVHSDAGPGVLNPGFADVTIENGTIQTQVSAGIVLNDADRNTLQGLRVIHLAFGNDPTSPVQLDRSDEALIQGNGFYGWTGALSLLESNRNLITENRTGYFLCPLVGDCSGFATGGGVDLSVSDDNVIELNSFSQGIFLLFSGSDRNLLRRNSFTLSIATGLFIVGHEDNVVEKNTVSHNAASGIGASGGTRTRIEKNVVSNNGLDGIAVSGDSTIVRHNVARGNRDDGIELGSPGIVVGHNRATGNGDLGIEAVPGVIDGRGNKASGNGNPLQCLNVSCK